MLTSLLLFLACSGDPSGATGPEAPPPGDAASNDVSPAGRGGDRTRLLGKTVMEGFETGTIIQIDAMVRDGDRERVGVSERFTRPGPFRLDIPGVHAEVLLVVYVDAGGDGPGAGDFRYEYEENPIPFDEGGRHGDGVVLLLSHPDNEGGGVESISDGPEVTDGAARNMVVGTLAADGFAATSRYRIDVSAETDGAMGVVTSHKLRGAGPFEINLEEVEPEAVSLSVQVFSGAEDAEGRTFEFAGNPVAVGADGAFGPVTFTIEPAGGE